MRFSLSSVDETDSRWAVVRVGPTSVGDIAATSQFCGAPSNGFVERVVHGANVEVNLFIVIRHVGEPFSVSLVVARVATLPRLRR